MGYECRVEADSVNRVGDRLVTLQVTFPRIVLAELNTHRMLSRNSASSRAIPVAKMIERVKADPFLPVWWGKNQSGMQAAEELSDVPRHEAKLHWLEARDNAVLSAQALLRTGLHKQIANRLLEPFLWHTAIISATEWDNFFALRCHKDAQPEIRIAAELMRDAIAKSEPAKVSDGAWHLPLVPDFDDLVRGGLQPLDIAKISCARCARVSVLAHDGKRDVQEDMRMGERLMAAGHWSPFEHAAVASPSILPIDAGNFRGWKQYRKHMPGEAVFKAA